MQTCSDVDEDTMRLYGQRYQISSRSNPGNTILNVIACEITDAIQLMQMIFILYSDCQ